MSQQVGYYQFPCIHNDTIVFVSEDDLWIVPVSGGIPIRLTANLGAVSHPALSPDGQHLAFVGREAGDQEVYLMPAAGGVARRLTFLGAKTVVVGWSTDGRSILFRSNAGQPFPIISNIYQIDREDGLHQKLPVGLAHQIAYSKTGETAIGRNNFCESAYWKRYRGGTAGAIWIDRAGDSNFQPLINLNGDLSCPMWIGKRIFFISDFEGISNLYSCTPSGTELKKHTNHTEYYVRNATTDGQRIVYQAGGDLFIYDPTTVIANRQIEIEFHSPQIQRQRKFVNSDKFMEDYDLHPDGSETLVTTRGKSFVMGNWQGPVTQLGDPDGVRYRLTRWLNDGKRFITISDQGGAEAIELWSTDLHTPPERLPDLNIGMAIELEVSPVADLVVLSNHRHEVVLVDLALRQSRILDRSKYQRIEGCCWSPDGRWVAYSCAETEKTQSIKICQIEDDLVCCLTPPRFRDFRPTFDPAGKFIYFLSVREFNPVSDNIFYDFSFPRGIRPYLISLTADLPSPFMPQPSSLASESANFPSGAGINDREPIVAIDFDGIELRIRAFPVPEGNYAQIWGLNGKVIFSSLPIRSSLDINWSSTIPEAVATIEIFDFTTQKHDQVATEVSNFRVARSSDTLIYRSRNRLRVGEIQYLANKQSSDALPSSETGWLDLNRIEVSVDPSQEWQQMLHEIWRLQRDLFWTADMSGVNWPRVFDRYAPLLERVSTRSEFSDLVWEMQGELGTSHTYEFGGDYRQVPNYQLGFLGADFAYDPSTDAYQVERIVSGDPWNENGSSPLQQLGANIRVGDLLLAVGGQRVSRHQSPQQLLVNQSGCEVNLTFAGIEPSASRTIAVKTLMSETPARYRDWVETNRTKVLTATSGKVGYLHIPDTSENGYAEFHRYYGVEVEREALIVDIRYNSGGGIAALLLEKLLRQRIGYDVTRWGQPAPYPEESMMGPIVVLTNEYSASGGDVFSHWVKLAKLGTLIGKRTWGGVIGILLRHSLVDGSLTSQPEESFWCQDVGWGVENYGTDPDITVEITPSDWVQNKDPQLNKGIQVILEQLSERAVSFPDFGDRPQLTLPT